MIITGDYHHTALAVARDVGMVRAEGQVVVIDTITPHEQCSGHEDARSQGNSEPAVSSLGASPNPGVPIVDAWASLADLNALVPVLRSTAPDPRASDKGLVLPVHKPSAPHSWACPRDPRPQLPKSSPADPRVSPEDPVHPGPQPSAPASASWVSPQKLKPSLPESSPPDPRAPQGCAVPSCAAPVVFAMPSAIAAQQAFDSDCFSSQDATHDPAQGSSWWSGQGLSQDLDWGPSQSPSQASRWGPGQGPSQGPSWAVGKGQNQVSSWIASQGESQGGAKVLTQSLNQGPSHRAMHNFAAVTKTKSVSWGVMPEAEEEQPATTQHLTGEVLIPTVLLVTW